MKSRIYEGWVRHRRFQPAVRTFRYRVFMMYVDLEELPGILDSYWCWSARGPALAWFRREDHLGDPTEPLDAEVRRLVLEKTGRYPEGPIRLLTHFRYFGYCMNPVSFYYCWDPSGDSVDAIVAEIHNTPWGERYCYVVDEHYAHRKTGGEFRKAFHVSPFFPMDQTYRWVLTTPDSQLLVHMDNLEEGSKVFDATMLLRQRPLDGPNLRRCLLKYPFLTGKVIGAIYWQAFRIWLRRIPFHPHPKHFEKARQYVK